MTQPTIAVTRYTDADHARWNAFIAASRNGTFMHDRRFMEYHKERFTDHSLIITADEAVVALLPANLHDHKLYSHQGLTYGGFIIGEAMTATLMLRTFAAVLRFLKAAGEVETLVYKCIPSIYHRYPADEDLYALFRAKAILFRRDITTTIDLRQPYPPIADRLRNYKLSQRRNIVVRPSDEWEKFHALLTEVFMARHQVKPVHSLEELTRLHRLLPDRLSLFGAYSPQNELLAGVLVFDKGPVVHTQYMVNSELGRKNGALDAAIYFLKDHYKDRHYLNFGISNEQGGWFLNEGLCHQKEGFGGRSIVHDFYEIDLATALAQDFCA